jgi:hypothetical protein
MAVLDWERDSCQRRVQWTCIPTSTATVGQCERAEDEILMKNEAERLIPPYFDIPSKE